MNQIEQNYAQLKKISEHASILSGIAQLLDWDQETYMPPGGANIRAIQLKTLAGVIHKAKTGKKFGNALGKLIDISTGKVKANDLSSKQKAALREWRKDYLKDKALPKSFVEEFAKLTSQSILVWRDAKKNDDFQCFSPFLSKIVAMSRKRAEFLGWEEHPYDALLDQYEPNMTRKDVSALFSNLKPSLMQLLKCILSAKQVDDSFLYENFSHQKQLEFSKKILNAMGYDEIHGRLDLSTHPFSSSLHPTDTRITTRFHPTNFMSCISVIMHEAGHALYERGLPVEHFGSPLGSSISLGMHESQSRWWETRIGQSKAFWKYYLPLLKKKFPEKLNPISLEVFYRGINKVEPSLIRVDADEVTYNLHVILRFEMEQELIEGTLKIQDTPEAWNAKMKELLGVTPKTYFEGCLQDIHWSMGGFGYFPAYTIGNLYAAQFFDAFVQRHKDWEKQISSGQLLFITEWLHENIHQYGREYQSKDLLKKITGQKFSSNAFIQYLTAKYSDIYGIYTHPKDVLA